MKYLANRTVCELAGQTLFEIERVGAAALKGSAELFVPDGRFIVAHGDSPISLFDHGDHLQIGGLVMSETTIKGANIGIQLRSGG